MQHPFSFSRTTGVPSTQRRKAHFPFRVKRERHIKKGWPSKFSSFTNEVQNQLFWLGGGGFKSIAKSLCWIVWFSLGMAFLTKTSITLPKEYAVYLSLSQRAPECHQVFVLQGNSSQLPPIKKPLQNSKVRLLLRFYPQKQNLHAHHHSPLELSRCGY